AEISFAKSRTDANYDVDFKGKSFEVQRFGANLSVPYMLDLIKTLRNQVDAIAISDLPSTFRIGGKSYVHRQYSEVMSTPTTVPLCDGSRIRELGTINSIHNLIERGEMDPTRGVFFPIGLLHLDVIYSLSAKYAKYFYFGDLLSIASLPVTLQPSEYVEKVG